MKKRDNVSQISLKEQMVFEIRGFIILGEVGLRFWERRRTG